MFEISFKNLNQLLLSLTMPQYGPVKLVITSISLDFNISVSVHVLF
jgi:hypothetical protein